MRKLSLVQQMALDAIIAKGGSIEAVHRKGGGCARLLLPSGDRFKIERRTLDALYKRGLVTREFVREEGWSGWTKHGWVTESENILLYTVKPQQPWSYR